MIIIPVGVDYQARRYPVVTFTLLGLNVFVFLLEVLAAFSGSAKEMFMTFALVPAQHGWWAWITSIFLHDGVFHLLGNMLYLFLFGACVEDLLGRGRFVAFYLCGGVFANAIQVMFSNDLNSGIPILGASGAISACIGAFLVVLPNTEINFRYLVFWIYSGEFWVRSKIVIVLWFVLDFISMIIDVNDPAEGGGVAFGAHVGGTIAGVVAMLAMRKKLELEQPSASRPAAINPALQPVRVNAPDPTELVPIYIAIDGNESGPFPTSSVRDMLKLGAIPAHAYYWRENMPEWRPVSEL